MAKLLGTTDQFLKSKINNTTRFSRSLSVTTVVSFFFFFFWLFLFLFLFCWSVGLCVCLSVCVSVCRYYVNCACQFSWRHFTSNHFLFFYFPFFFFYLLYGENVVSNVVAFWFHFTRCRIVNCSDDFILLAPPRLNDLLLQNIWLGAITCSYCGAARMEGSFSTLFPFSFLFTLFSFES